MKVLKQNEFLKWLKKINAEEQSRGDLVLGGAYLTNRLLLKKEYHHHSLKMVGVH